MPSPSTVLLRAQSDERLVALARNGHERAFEAIVERYRRPLLRACRRILPEARAEDALQQSLIAAWRGLERGVEVREVRPWLYRIAHNTALNQLRLSGYDYDELRDSLRLAPAPDEEIERRAVMRQTLAGLAALPERQRQALLQVAVEGRPNEEVARELGLTSGAVRQLVHRARITLRAAATAITPLPLVSWLTAASTRGEPMAQRIVELTAGAGSAGAAAALAKAGAVVVLAGGAVTGPALVERGGGTRHSGEAIAAQVSDRGSAAPQRAASAPARPSPRRLPVTGRPGAPGARVQAGGGEDRGGHSGPSSGNDRSAAGDHFEDGDDRHRSRSGPSGDGDRSGSDDDPRESDDLEPSHSGSSGSGTSGSGSSGSGEDGLPLAEGDLLPGDELTSGSGTSGSGVSGGGGGDELVPDSGSGSSGPGSGSDDDR